MASFTIKIKGTKKNISKFFSALTHEGDVRMGRGAEADICYLSKREALITGICKDNIHNDLIAEAKYRSSLDAPKESITLLMHAKNIVSVWNFIPKMLLFLSIIRVPEEKLKRAVVVF